MQRFPLAAKVICSMVPGQLCPSASSSRLVRAVHCLTSASRAPASHSTSTAAHARRLRGLLQPALGGQLRHSSTAARSLSDGSAEAGTSEVVDSDPAAVVDEPLQAGNGSSAMSEPVDAGPDYFGGAMPKAEIGALRLLDKHPTYDGRGTIVAIFDTGVDPAAAGLQVTTDGKPKFVDLLDGSGSGDVDTSTIVEAEDGCIKALDGSLLKVNPEWANPTGKWHVGSKALFELYPGGCKARVSAKRKELWAEKQRAAVAKATAALTAFDPKDLTAEAKKSQKSEAEARVALLKEHAENHSDTGPVVQCVVWHDGDAWRGALDTQDLYADGSGAGALADATPMTNFRAERQFGTFSALDACNYALNVYDDGCTLSIVVDTGSHGTHVAGITSAHHPEYSPFNGVAPGAQVVSCKIGDTRVGGMETGPALTRALVAVLENGVDVINMSYGEPTTTPNLGRFIELAKEVVQDHGVIFVSSAGNSGPGLTTVGAPGGSTSCIYAIGAYVSPALAAAGHSTRDEAHAEGWEGQQYNWSSRGPSADGHVGVSFCAPGGAIASVPQWCQQSRQLMNGTSMSSPNACGGVALLLSACKQEGLAHSPARVRRAIENTCKVLSDDPNDTLKYGRGMMQVDKALEYLQKSGDVDMPDASYDVTVKRSDSQARTRGVYMRDALEVAAPSTYAVMLQPRLHKDADIRESKLKVEDKLVLESTAEWLTAPGHLLVPHNGRDFEIRIDPTGLAPGLHYAEVRAMDSTALWRGPLARVPVTICKAHPTAGAPSGVASASTNGIHFGPMEFTAGQEHRHYVQVPSGATWAEMTVHAGKHEATKQFMIHTTQLLPQKRPVQNRSSPLLTSEASTSTLFPVTADAGLEIALAQFWKSPGASSISLDIQFHGLAVNTDNVLLEGASHSVPFSVHAPLRRTKLALKASLDTLRIPLRPSASHLTPLDTPRDTLPSSKIIHRLVLTYNLTLAEGGKIKPVVVPLSEAVYDGALEGQLYAVFDTNKKLLSFGDVYPSDVTVPKGDYVIKLALRHDDADVLNKMRDLALRVEMALDKPVDVPIFSLKSAAVTEAKEGKGKTDRVLREGERAQFHMGPVAEDKLPKDAKPGCSLAGSMKLAKSSATSGEKEAPGKVAVVYTVMPPKVAAKEEGEEKEDEEGKSSKEKRAETMRDAEIKFLKAMTTKEASDEALYKEVRESLLADWPGHLPLLQERLDRAAATTGDDRAGALPEIVAAADEVIAAVDQVALAQFVALKNDNEGPEGARYKKKMTAEKAAFLSGLHLKCKAQLEMLEAQAGGDDAMSAAFEATFKDLRKWVDTLSADYVELHAAREAQAGRHASAIKALDTVINSKDKLPTKELLARKSKLLKELGWDHWAKLSEASTANAFPDSYPLF